MLARQVLSTPLEELEERRKAAFKAIGKIKQGETPCAKALEDVFMVWEVLMEDATIERIRPNMHATEEKITTEKAYMKNLAFQEKVAKMTEIKRLQ